MKINIESPDKVTPLVLRLRRRLHNVALGPAAKTLSSFDIVLGIKDESSAQTATICFSKASIILNKGIVDNTDCIATGKLNDFNNLSCDDEQGKAVIAAINADGPTLDSAANAFWDEAQGQYGVPSGLIIQATDSKERFQFGDGETFEVHGSTKDLLQFLTSENMLMDMVGVLAVKGNIPALCSLTGFGMGRLFDE